MEQRDAIVKNLREISHFFLSENKQDESRQKTEQTTLSPAVKPAKKHAEPNRQTNHAVIAPIRHPYFQAAQDPTIYYTVNHGSSIPMMAALGSVSLELGMFGHRCSIVGTRDSIEKMTETILRARPEVHRNTESLLASDIDVSYIANGNSDFSITLVGRSHFDCGAQIEQYMHEVKSVFITDFPIAHIKERVHDKHPAHLICFTRPNPEDAFRIYVDLKEMITANRNVWCGIVVCDSPSVPEALRVYTSIAQTLSKFTDVKPHYLGYTTRKIHGAVPGTNRLSQVPSERTTSIIARHLSRWMPNGMINNEQ
ncbi:MAG: hypothetical protein RBU23_00840 [Candidatus Auribacterota bacterium]|jgi:hypothetical protein|nr:hypothetical protein [Candidatus Auribacterota bacterium]